MSVTGHARALVALGPAENDHWAALRIGLSVAIPCLLLFAVGRPDLSVYAVFGAFTGMYGRNEPHQLRLSHQASAAVMLVSGVSIGVLLSLNHIESWALVAIESFLAGVGSLFADRVGLRPSGPFFGMFALGACASVPLTVAPLSAILICVASAAVSLVIGFAGWVRDRRWQFGLRHTLSPGTAWMRLTAVSYVLAVGAAGSLSTLLGIGHPIWAMAAAAVPLAAVGVSNRLRRGVHRILGTLVGLAITALVLLPNGPPGPIVLVALVIVLQFPTELFMTRNYGLALVFFTPLILLMTYLAHPTDAGTLITERAVETVLGAVVGITVVWFIRPSSSPAAQAPTNAA